MHKSFGQATKALALGLSLASLVACQNNKNETPENLGALAENETAQANPKNWPKNIAKKYTDPAVEQKVADILATMTIEQKVAQTIQPEIRAITIEDMRTYGFGSYLNGGGAFPDNNKYATMADWVALAEKLYQASIDDSIDGSNIPTMWGTDAVHGHNNVIGATLYPHNIGLGAMNNPELVGEIASATAKVVEVTGIDWTFAPTVAVARDDRWGRTYESYSEDPEIVKAYSGIFVKNMQGEGDEFLGDGKVIATIKHFVGDGGTDKGDDQGNFIGTEAELRDIHAQGYVSGLAAGAQTVMASFNSWNGVKMHGNRTMLTDVLKDRMGFEGLIVGDWSGHGQIEGCSNVSCPESMNAGLDIFMVPDDWKGLYENTVQQVKDGIIPMARLDDAVTRILRVKLRAGVFDGGPSTREYAAKSEFIGSAEHRDISRRAVRQSLVMLKNNDGVLPIDPKLNILVAGNGADNIGKQTAGWSISWQGTGNVNSDFPGGTSIYKGIADAVTAAGGKTQLSVEGEYEAKPDVAVVVFGENPYAEGEGDITHIEYQYGNKQDIKLLKKLKADGIPVVSVFLTGRPLWTNKELNASDAFVVAWLPGTEGQGVADVILQAADGKVAYDFKGKLSFSWPKYDDQVVINYKDKDYDPLFAYGFGLTYADSVNLPELSEENRITAEASASDPLVLFQNRAQPGLGVYLGDKANWSVPVATSIVTTQGSDNVKLTSINWVVQEDAREIAFKGDSPGQVYLAYVEGMDLTRYLDKDTAITFDFKVDQQPVAAFNFLMSCGDDCGASVDMKDTLKNRTPGQWDRISIDIACFAKEGMDFGKVISPFTLYSEGAAKIGFANISLAPGKAVDADIKCSE